MNRHISAGKLSTGERRGSTQARGLRPRRREAAGAAWLLLPIGLRIDERRWSDGSPADRRKEILVVPPNVGENRRISVFLRPLASCRRYQLPPRGPRSRWMFSLRAGIKGQYSAALDPVVSRSSTKWRRASDSQRLNKSPVLMPRRSNWSPIVTWPCTKGLTNPRSTSAPPMRLSPTSVVLPPPARPEIRVIPIPAPR